MLFLIVFFSFIATAISENKSLPEVYLDMPDIVSFYHYPVETHKVITQDGYILTMHRIPGSDPLKPPVLLQPGNICSSAVYVLNRPGHALAYLLYDAGYDVWIANHRGTTYSTKHVYYNSDTDDEYWNFSLDELIFRDLPAEIDYVLNKTGREKLFYVGHSIGATMILGLGAELPEYNDKVLAAVILGPTFYLYNMRGPFKALAPINRELEILTKSFGIQGIAFRDINIGSFHDRPCSSTKQGRFICALLTFVTLGFSGGHYNETLLPAMTAHLPAGASIKLMVHLMQAHLYGYTRRFDYGPEENKFRYGQPDAPDFKMENFRIPVAVISGENDFWADPASIASLDDIIKGKQLAETVILPGYMHLDYLFGIDAAELVNIPIIQLFERVMNEGLVAFNK